MAAATAIVNTALVLNTMAVAPTPAAVEATNGALVTFNKADGKILVILTNIAVGAKTCTLKAGNGLQGVDDLALSLTASSTNFIVIESMKYVNMTGDNKGKLVIIGEDANVKVSAVVLP